MRISEPRPGGARDTGPVTAATRLPGSTRLKGIQAMRFVAALLVVITHSTLYAHDRLDPHIKIWHFGEIGVPIFFAISGLVMIVSTQRGFGRPGFARDFAIRRVIRIAPTYWLATTVKLLTLILVPGAVLHATLSWSNVFWSYLFLPSRQPDSSISPLLGVGWTLIFEMMFYAVFTIALLLRVRPLLFCGAVLAVLAIGSPFFDDSDPVVTYYFNPVVLYFLIGMVIGTFVIDRSVRRLAMNLTAALLVALATCSMSLLFRSGAFATEVFVHYLIVAALILAVVLCEPFVHRFLPRVFLHLGDASYTMYLFHPLIAPAVPAVLARLGLISLGLSVVLSVALVVVSTWFLYRIFEKPVTDALLSKYRRARAR